MRVRDVERGVAQRDQRLAAGQRDRIEEPLIPRHDLLWERNAEFQIAADLPDDQIAATQIEAAAKARAERTATFSRRIKLQNDHDERDRKRGQQAKEDQPAAFDEG